MKEEEEEERAVVEEEEEVMIPGFPRIGNSWIDERRPTVLRVYVGQTAYSVVAQCRRQAIGACRQPLIA